MFEKKKEWKKKEDLVVAEDILEGLDYSDVSDIQQMLYHAYKKIESLEARILKLKKNKK